MTQNRFSGFGRETQRFLKDLAANNNRAWFNANKDRYEQFVVQPPRDGSGGRHCSARELGRSDSFAPILSPVLHHPRSGVSVARCV